MKQGRIKRTIEQRLSYCCKFRGNWVTWETWWKRIICNAPPFVMCRDDRRKLPCRAKTSYYLIFYSLASGNNSCQPLTTMVPPPPHSTWSTTKKKKMGHYGVVNDNGTAPRQRRVNSPSQGPQSQTDCFADALMLFLHPGAATLLTIFNRNHNVRACF